MKTLYVSDLDGTLLNGDSKIPNRALEKINSLIREGLLFTVATGRSYTSVTPVVEGLHLKLPAILLNGVHLFDLSAKRTVYTKYIGKPETRAILALLKREGTTPFVYKMREDGNINMYYDEITSDMARTYINDRYLYYSSLCNYEAVERKNLCQVCDSPQICFMFAVDEREDRLQAIEREIKKMPFVHCHFYKEERLGLSSIEIFASDAGKNKGIRYLKKQTGAERVVSFGDNYNDIDMKLDSDLFCVVDNAPPEVKKHADLIIESNNDNGVLQFILDDLRQNS